MSRPAARRRLVAAISIVVLATALAGPAGAATDGDSELAEAITASREAFDDGAAEGAVLARADEVVDARAGSPLAEAVGGPLLLTQPDRLASQTAGELQRVLPREATVHLLGGPAALSPGVAETVQDLGFDVVRHGGATRFETAQEIAHAVAGLRGFAIEDVDARGHPEEVVVQVSRPVELDDDAPASAWSLTEDGDARPVDLVEAGAEDLAVVLAVDISNTAGADTLAAAREATTGFVGQMPAGARVGVVTAAPEGAELAQPPSDDHATVRARLRDLQPRGGSLHEAVSTSIDAVDDAEVPAVVVLSDATGVASDLGETLDLVREAEVTVHVVELLTGDGESPELAALATAGGGRRVPAGDPAALAPLYDDLAYDLVGPQRLVYTSETGGETDLTVTVEHGDVRAQASTTVALPEHPAIVTPSWWATDTGLMAGAALVYVALALAILALLAPQTPASQLTGAMERRRRADRSASALAGISDRLVTATDDALRRQGRRGAINQALERAGVALRPGELVVLATCAAVAAFAVGFLLVAWWFGLVLGALVPLATKVAVSAKADRRQQRFVAQLSDTLQVLAGGLRSGHGLQQALHVAAQEADAPTSEELSRVVVETRLGRDLMDALRAMARRMGSEDFDWVIQAVDIQREVGGDLAEVLDTVAGTVRERARIHRQVQSLSAEGRLSAWILFVLPVAIAGFIFMTNPAYLAQLTSSGLGYAMLAIGAGLLAVGGVWLRKLVDLEY